MNIENLLENIKAGDTNALQNLYDIFSPMMRDICMRITKEDEDTINDLVQDSFILVYYSLDRLKNPNKFKGWCATITKNVCFKYLKKKQKLQLIPFSSLMDEEMNIRTTLTPETLLEEKDILKIINTLPTGYGKVFQMAVIEGFSHQEIAKKIRYFPHAVLLRHGRVACHCFMSFGLCDKNGTTNCGYKSQPLSARQTKKSPWQYSLEVFQGIPPRIFLAIP